MDLTYGNDFEGILAMGVLSDVYGQNRLTSVARTTEIVLPPAAYRVVAPPWEAKNLVHVVEVRYREVIDPQVLERHKSHDTGIRFVWDESAGHPANGNITIHCVTVTNDKDTRATVEKYHRAGVVMRNIVVVGNLLDLSDETYYALTEAGVLVEELPPGRSLQVRRERLQLQLAPFYRGLYRLSRGIVVPDKPYTYTPSPFGLPTPELEQIGRHLAGNKKPR